MKSITEISNGLNYFQKTHKSLKELFNAFKAAVPHIQNPPVRNITYDENNIIKFIDREYKFSFSVGSVANELKGIISFERILDEETTSYVASIIFDEKENAYIEKYDDEKTFLISSDSNCIVTIMNILFIDINKPHVPR